MKILFGCSQLVVFNLMVSLPALADPTRPATGWQATGNTLGEQAVVVPQLQLIKQTENGLVALINGELVRKGGFYQQYQVLDIQNKQVVLQRDGEQHILPLHKTAIKNYEK